MFIGRKPDNSIYGTWSVPQPRDADHPGLEEVLDTDPELVAFLSRPTPIVEDRVKKVDDKVATLEARIEALETKSGKP